MSQLKQSVQEFESHHASTSIGILNPRLRNFDPTRIARKTEESWESLLKGEIRELTEMNIGWDGYDGVPITPEVKETALKLLKKLFVPGIPAPSLGPCSNGSLLLEWFMKKYELEIHIHASGGMTVCREDIETEIESSLELKSLEDDFSEVQKWISE